MSRRFSPIAIVGQGCVLPGALTPDALWQLTLAGRSALTRGDHAFGKAMGGYVQDFERVFDPRGFALSEDELRGLDPVFTWTLHAAREAMRAAGLEVGDHPRALVVLGNLSYPTPALSRFAREVRAGADSPSVDPRNRFMSGFPASLVAKAIGFRAGGFALDAACASSLYAIKLACDRLHDRTADLALAGGVNHTGDLFLHAGFMALAALSPSGRSRPFHRDADGLVPAQGAAMILLKRLDDAEANGDAILGVIRGIGLSNDGRSRGLLVPSEDGQTRAMRAAYETSGTSPSEISLVECHATGTQVGDATELRGMQAIFAESRDVPIGSLKGNLGHLVTASGIAALIKVLGAIRARTRPPTIHCEAPLDEAKGAPFRLLREPEPWPEPRRAAISSFGFGGNNAHLIVEEWTGPRRAGELRSHDPSASDSDGDIAVIAKAVFAGSATTEAFDRAVLDGTSLGTDDLDGVRATDFEIDVAGLRFPPADLRETLPQQLRMLELARGIAHVAQGTASERSSLVVGMQIDGEVTRLSHRVEEAATQRSTHTPLTAASTVGCMPNVVANRVSHQLDIRGPSFTVSAEEASGTVALELAMRSLREGEIDLAFVGAIDMGCEDVHRAAARALLPLDRQTPADAGVLFALKRLRDAEAQGDTVLAVLSGEEARADEPRADEPREPRLILRSTPGDPGLAAQLGHAHAASGLLHVAAAVTACEHRALPARASLPRMPWLPSSGRRSARVDIVATPFGPTTSTAIRSFERASRMPARSTTTACVALFGGSDLAETIRALDAGRPMASSSRVRVAIVAPDDDEMFARIERATTILRENASTSDLPRFAELGEGIYFGTGDVEGEVAFVFTGPAGAYPHMGRDLALALPELVDGLAGKSGGDSDVGWLYDKDVTYRGSTLEKLYGSAFLALLHAELTRGLVGIEPQASIGYCSGETNALFALGVWSDFDAFRRDIDHSGVFTRELAGELSALRRAWNAPHDAPIGWATYRVRATIDAIHAALQDEPRVHLTIINGRNDVIIGGDPAGCARVAEKVGPMRARSLEYDMVMHCPEARVFATEWRELHRRPAEPVPNIRFYTHATCSSYVPTSDAAADALVGQAMNVVDFPALVERAYADGVRVFIEHGPHAGCTKWIDDVLGGRPHVAVALDRFGRSSLLQSLDSIATLAACGVPMRFDVVAARLGPRFSTSAAGKAGASHPTPSVNATRTDTDGAPTASRVGRSLRLRFASHPEAPTPPPTPSRAPLPNPQRDSDLAAYGEPVEYMQPAPRLPSPSSAAKGSWERAASNGDGAASRSAHGAATNGASAAQRTPPIDASTSHPVVAERADAIRALAIHQAAIADLHTEFLRQQAAVQAELVALCLAPFPTTPAASSSAPAATRVPAKKSLRAARATTPSAPMRVRERRLPTGPSFGRTQLETLAGGKISSVLGPLFEKQDAYQRQVRMPQPPLLLADRVTGLEGEAGSMTSGTIWTETDITEDAWYLHEGRMPAGIFVESGQADLLLVSWLGIDFHNRGERVYRLLGCDLTSHGELPAIGDTLCHTIQIDGHASEAGVHIFSFSSDCHIGGELRLSVRNGQAGFFTDAELESSAGIRWRPENDGPAPSENPRLDPPAARCVKSSFTKEEIGALVGGRAFECFGAGFERASTHWRTPTIQSGGMRLVDEVTSFDPSGGPWGRGTMRARLAISSDHWFFEGHFKDDPCMPGTLMVEGGLQTMAIYLAAMGYTLPRDGWRFEIVPHETYRLRCRGQTTPKSKELVYDLFVHEIIEGPMPTIYADILGTVDGLPSFHLARLGMRLVPGWPNDKGRMSFPVDPETRPTARVGDIVFDRRFMFLSALGRPSAAYGESFAAYDDARAMPRSPGPPYLFMSRVATVDAPVGQMKTGCSAAVEYDVPADAWFLDDNCRRVVPLSALLEIALQPCGYLGTYAGCVLSAKEDVYIRNLDGTGTLHREIPGDVGTLTTTVKMTSLSTAGSLIIVGFDLSICAEDVTYYTANTVFGFFTKTTLQHQVGLPTTDEQRARLIEPSSIAFSVRDRPSLMSGPLRLARGKLLMIDRVTGLWPEGGKARLGRVRTEKDVRFADWFFKAHFFQDPVQPGSLGLEAMVQALQALVVERGLADGIAHVSLVASDVDLPMTWKYRGQVLPENDIITIDLEITSIEDDAAQRRRIIAEGSLWVDGKRIYSAHGIVLKLTSRPR